MVPVPEKAPEVHTPPAHPPVGITTLVTGSIAVVLAVLLFALGNSYLNDSNKRTPKCIVTLGDAGSDEGEMNMPIAVAVDRNGNVYLSDWGNSRIQKFDSNGQFLLAWGTPGSAPGQFNTPQQLAIDSQDRLYVVEAGNNRVQRFDLNGNFLGGWGSLGSEPGQFKQPWGLAISAKDENLCHRLEQ